MKYYRLAKPGIIYGNSLAAIAGFLLACRGIVSWPLFISTLVGLGLVIGGSAVFNNYLDRDIDARMERTKSRASVTGEISPKNILIYGFCLLLVGLFILYWFTNALTLAIALIGVFFYVVLYSPLKRRTVYSPLVGSIAGAVPPLVGFCAVTNSFNLEAFIVFLIFVFWQMPHFYAIATYKKNDYAAASIPVLPIEKGMRVTKIHIVSYVAAFTISAILLTVFGFTGRIYLVVMLILGVSWLWLGLQGFRSSIDDIRWAKKMFFFSLIVMIVLSIALSFGSILP